MFSRAVGREEHCKQIWTLWGVLPVSWPHWVCPCSWRVCWTRLHCLGSRLLCQELSEAGPELYALPRSKPLRFRYLGSHQRHRLGWFCILCSSDLVTKTLGFWTVNIHLRRCASCTPRKPSGRDRGGDKSQRPPSPNTWSPERLGLGKGTKHRPNRVCASEDYTST